MVPLFLSALLALTQPNQSSPVEADAVPPATAVAPEEPEEPEVDPDPEVCRSRLVPSTRMGERNRRVQICKPRSEWANDNRSRMRR